MRQAGWILSLAMMAVVSAAHGAETNCFAYLDEPVNPYYVHRHFPHLTTPQWIGEPNVQAVVVLAIDDLRDTAQYESYLRPILDRLKRIDGRAPVSIMTNRVAPDDPQLSRWLKEGLSIETHTLDHPCPLLSGGDLPKARATFENCVDLINQIKGNHPVAFRMPCCDSRNTPSPRYWTEIFDRTTPAGKFLSIDSSVFNIFTSDDDRLPHDLVTNDDGSERFPRYVPFPSFVNTIKNYPYPYVVGRLCWEFPCVVPSDWQAQHVQQPNNPRTLEDLKAALDATVVKQGVLNLVFHPHGWLRNAQVVEFIDHAATTYGERVKFLNFREAHECLTRWLLDGSPLRDASGRDNGVRLLDLNRDGFMDVVIGNDDVQVTRLWRPQTRQWETSRFPTPIVRQWSGTKRDAGVRFVLPSVAMGQTVALVRNEHVSGAWRFDGGQWVPDPRFLEGLSADGKPLSFFHQGRDRGVRIRDIDGDGTVELIVGNPDQSAVYQWNARDGRWHLLDITLPPGVSIVDNQGRDAGFRWVDMNEDGRLDIIISNEQRYGAYLFQSIEEGWAIKLREGQRGDEGSIPAITLFGRNNGAWFHSGSLWLQNESTDRLPDGVDRMALADLLKAHEGVAGFPGPKSPQQSLADISVPPGLKVELVASEPLVTDPIAFDWGPDGRLWVIEMVDYPEGLDGEGQPGGRVTVLCDSDGDGKYDRATVFVDGLLYPTAVKSWRDGVLVLCAPEIFYAEDCDGDGRADRRETLFRGFRRGNPQHLANGLRWGLDNWLYVANGDSGGLIKSLKTGQTLAISGRDVRVRPDTGEMDALSGQTQYGRDRDDWGNWFGGNNSNPVWHYVLEDRYLRRNPSLVPPDPRKHVPDRPGSAPVYPISRTLQRFNDLEMANRITSACSPMVYRDDLLGPEYYGNTFVCENAHNLVHREIVSPDGVSFRSRRAEDEQRREFVASRDCWFRPVMVRTGPDGAFWIADMYRLVIEHPDLIPERWQRKLNLRDGCDLGRIYRVVPEMQPLRQPPRLDTLDTAGLVAALDSPNGRQRDMAQEMLVCRGDKTCGPLLEQMALSADRPLARLHALCTLDGLGILRPETLIRALADPHPGIVRHAIRLSEPVLGENGPVGRAVLATLERPEMTVHFQLALSLGNWPHEPAWNALAQLAAKYHNRPYLRTAVLSSLTNESVGYVFREVMAAHQDGEALGDLTARLAEVVAALGGPTDVNQAFESLLATTGDGSFGWRVTAVTAMLDALQRRGMPTGRRVPAVAQSALAQLYDRARGILQDEDASEGARRLGLALLGRNDAPTAEDIRQIREMLGANQPVGVQTAAVEALARIAEDQTPELLLADWASHSPRLRRRILDELLTRIVWTEDLLRAIEGGKVAPSHIDARRRQLLLSHEDELVRQWASRLLENVRTASRSEIMDQYLDVLSMDADVTRGKTVFANKCATCHRLEGVGYVVGPDLNNIMNRSPQTIWTAILDPNQALEDKFIDYTLWLVDGRQASGMIGRESSNSIVLLGQEGKETVVFRSQIEELHASGKSLMPEGLEREMSKQELADVIAYVSSRRPEPKPFPGNRPAVATVRDDGSIRLLAVHGRVYGPTLVFEPSNRNLGKWQSRDDYAAWLVEVPAPGSYRVVIEYACAEDAAGDSFIIQAAGQTIGGRVQSTGAWDNYQTQPVGELTLPEGAVEVSVRGDGAIRSFLMNLRGIRLYP